MSKLYQIVGPPKSGVPTIAYLFSQNNIRVGSIMGNNLGERDPMSSICTRDEQLIASFQDVLTQPGPMMYDLSSPLDTAAINELSGYVRLVLRSADWGVRDYEAMLVAEHLLDVAEDASLIVCSRSKEDVITALTQFDSVPPPTPEDEEIPSPTIENAGDAYDFWLTKVQAVQSLYESRGKPVLEVAFDDMTSDSDGVLSSLMTFLNRPLMCEFEGGLSWIDMLINATDLDFYSRFE